MCELISSSASKKKSGTPDESPYPHCDLSLCRVPNIVPKTTKSTTFVRSKDVSGTGSRHILATDVMKLFIMNKLIIVMA